MKNPVVLSRGQYLQVDGLLHGFKSRCLGVLSVFLVLVEARNKWSDKFLLRRRPKMISATNNWHEVLVLPNNSQSWLIIS